MALSRTRLQDFTALGEQLRPLAEARLFVDYDEFGNYAERREAFTGRGAAALATFDTSPLYSWGTLPPAAIGWRSFVGLPGRVAGLPGGYLAGAEAIFGHPHRGPCPSFDLYWIAGRAHLALSRGLAGLPAPSPALEAMSRGVRWRRPAYGYVIGDAAAPEDHLGVETEVLLRASVAVARGETPVIRTALLSPAQIPKQGKFIIGIGQFVIAQMTDEARAGLARQGLPSARS